MDDLILTPETIIPFGNVSAIIRHAKYSDLVLCVQNLEYPDRLWGLIGGGIKYGETLFNAAQRECAEEGEMKKGRIWIESMEFVYKKPGTTVNGCVDWMEFHKQQTSPEPKRKYHHSFWNVTEWRIREDSDEFINFDLVHPMESDPGISKPRWLSVTKNILSGEYPFNPQHLPALFKGFGIDPRKNIQAAQLLKKVV